MNVTIEQLLQEMNTHNASDLHLKEGAQPFYRLNGALTPVRRDPLTREELLETLGKVMPERMKAVWERDGAVDFAFSLDRQTRFRTNAYYQRGLISVALRRLQHVQLSFADLHLPDVLYSLADLRRGMILFTGPTGTGKSTTMAAMLDRINEMRREHIITIEDPIEFVFQDNKSVIDQREIGADCPTFEMALRHAMRQDPDVILVGEMRDAETITSAIRAALTGHLVISTLHTINAAMTMGRMIQYFPPNEQQSIRSDLAESLKAVVSQRLIRSGDGKTRVPIVEVMIVNELVRKLILEDRLSDLRQVMQNGMDGMQSFDQSLVGLVRDGVIGDQEGEAYCEDLQGYRRAIRGELAGGDGSRILSGR